jgi:3-methylfumaryl-CoA hydratase
VADYQSWIGREERARVTIDPLSVERMSALLDRVQAPQPGDALPALWHWMFLNTPPVARDLGNDGHPAKTALLPAVPLPRRMWAGSRVRFLGPLRVGETCERVTTVRSIEGKTGRSGALVFVTLHHVFRDHEGPLIDEEQDLVYREAASAGAPPDAPPPRPAALFTRVVRPDPVLLFRYSAVTFNAHRIHIDRAYATREEGYPGLVVQAPLTATLLLELLQGEKPGVRVDEVRFRAIAPLTDREPITLCGRLDGREATLWAGSAAGSVALRMELALGRDANA